MSDNKHSDARKRQFVALLQPCSDIPDQWIVEYAEVSRNVALFMEQQIRAQRYGSVTQGKGPVDAISSLAEALEIMGFHDEDV